MSTRLAVTGVGAVTPLGVGAVTLVDRWIAGESGIADGLGRCREFDPGEAMSRREVRRSDRCTQLAVAAAQEAFESAGWDDKPPLEPERIGCIIGTGIGGLGTLETQHDVMRDEGADRVSPLSVPLMMPNAPAAAIAMRTGLHGPVYGVVSACAAGTHAIGTGMRLLQAGDADAVVVGGTESAFTQLAISAFSAMGATSTTGVSRPFDARRDGFVMGEGAGVLILERADDALARGAAIHGFLDGYGATSDAFHLTAPDPEAGASTRAIKLALEDAGLTAGDLDYINAHGTSTPLNDRSETNAIKQALGSIAANIPVSSLKSCIGHLLGAAGAVEAIATIGALSRAIAPPTINYGEPDEGLDLDYVPNQAKPLPADGELRALSNSFGFGGHNAVICLAA